MNPINDPWSTSTPVAGPARAPERQARVFDTVKVAPETFRSVMFMSSNARKEFTRDRVRDEDKPQKRTQDGVALWSVSLAAVNWRGKSELINVTVPMYDDPAQKFQVGDPVRLAGLTFGVSPKRDGGGFVTWCSADAVEPVGMPVAKASAS